ncbi:hypothetical protein [Nocardia salmonicida]|uniref:hypothetical protein n=1 Tax=Nocardia salmonicida TaxID=53431 RepID=UPI003CE93753
MTSATEVRVGIIDQVAGTYAHIATFTVRAGIEVTDLDHGVPVDAIHQFSHDFNRLAAVRNDAVGWIDHHGTFTNATSAITQTPFRPRVVQWDPAFDDDDNFYFIEGESKLSGNATRVVAAGAHDASASTVIEKGTVLTGPNGKPIEVADFSCAAPGSGRFLRDWLDPQHYISYDPTRFGSGTSHEVAVVPFDPNANSDCAVGQNLLPADNPNTILAAVGSPRGEAVVVQAGGALYLITVADKVVTRIAVAANTLPASSYIVIGWR